MIELFSALSVSEIIVYCIMIALALKGLADFIEWIRENYQKKFNKDYNAKNKQETLEQQYQKSLEQHQESIEMYNSLGKKIDCLSENIDDRFKKLDEQIRQLNKTDKHTIKQMIVKDYHHFTEECGWIDDFSLDTILLLYNDYKKLGGNTYVDNLIEEIKKLPRVRPEEK